MKKSLIPILLFASIVLLSWKMKEYFQQSENDWSEYLGGPGRNHYSTLKQVDTTNVSQLVKAWQYQTFDSGQIQCNPIIINGVLYGMTATTQPFAIDAGTGKELWRKKNEGAEKLSSSRGLSYWEKDNDKRILYTNGEWLYAIEAASGKPILSFGIDGRTSLKAGLGTSAKNKMVISNTPGTVYGDLIVMPLRVSEGSDAAFGHIQAFNIVTGKLAWVFHTIPLPGEYGYSTWPKETYKNTDVGAANNWAGMAVDRKRGILFVPTGSAAADFYGGNRVGKNLFANCLLALDARTGKRLWHFQMVHHDILDRDPPAPPNLVTVKRNGKMVDAVAQVTKQGFVFVFNRVTGEPFFPVIEKPVPASDIPGEKSWTTQPFPLLPAPYARQHFTINDINPNAANKNELSEVFKRSRSEGPFTPLSKQGTIVFPGLDGGAEWGGAAADPQGIMYVNSSEMPWLISLNELPSPEQLKGLSPGNQLYINNCVACHGNNLEGNKASGFPSLYDVKNRLTKEQFITIITNGKNRMPPFPGLSAKQKDDLVAFIFNEEQKNNTVKAKQVAVNATKNNKPVYKISGYSKFLDKDGFPAIKPPWGTLNAIDLNTGKYVWKIPFGTTPELEAKGHPQTGAESYGGPVVTAGGLLFIAATKDKMFKAYNKFNGKLLWQTALPAAGFATPGTYQVNGKQYIVIACGGSKLGAPAGDSFVAYALP